MGKNQPRSRLHARGPEFAIVARFANGSEAFYYTDDTVRDTEGKLLEQWGRQSRAARFGTEAEARKLTNLFQVNSVAKEYIVVRLPPRT